MCERCENCPCLDVKLDFEKCSKQYPKLRDEILSIFPNADVSDMMEENDGYRVVSRAITFCNPRNVYEIVEGMYRFETGVWSVYNILGNGYKGNRSLVETVEMYLTELTERCKKALEISERKLEEFRALMPKENENE